MVGGIENLGGGDEVKEDGGDSGRDGDVAPPGAIVDGSGQNGERCYAVEKDRDSEPEEGHSDRTRALNSRIFSISGPGKIPARLVEQPDFVSGTNGSFDQDCGVDSGFAIVGPGDALHH